MRGCCGGACCAALVLLQRAQPTARPSLPPSQVTQDELVQILRSDGRRQAAQRMMKQKREGQSQYADSD